MRNIERFTRQNETYQSAPVDNYEGAPAWTLPDDERVVQLLMTGTFGNTFYATGNEITEQFIEAMQAMAAEEPMFLAQSVVYARQRGFMRTAPIVALVILREAVKDDETGRDLFRAAWRAVMRTPKDVQQYVEIARGGVLAGGLTKTDKALIAEFLHNLTPYHAIKYAKGGQGYALRDILRLVRPKPKTNAQNALFAWLVDPAKYHKRKTRLEQIDALEALKEQPTAELVRKGRLPHEVVTGTVSEMTPELWRAVLNDMPYFATLRNLQAMDRAGVFADGEAVGMVVDRLTNGEALRGARVLPFRLYAAYRAFTGPEPIRDALRLALDLSFVNVPILTGRVAIAPDVSGSMTGGLSDRSGLRFVDVAGIFAGALVTQSDGTLVLPFQSYLLEWQADWSRGTSMEVAGRVAALVGGGTNMGAPIEHLMEQHAIVDTFVGITDNEDWQGSGFLVRWQQYKRIAPEAQAFLVRIDPYRHRVAPVNEPAVHFLFGWSDAVLSYIANHSAGSQVDAVRAIELA